MKTTALLEFTDRAVERAWHNQAFHRTYAQLDFVLVVINTISNMLIFYRFVNSGASPAKDVSRGWGLISIDLAIAAMHVWFITCRRAVYGRYRAVSVAALRTARWGGGWGSGGAG